MTSVKRPLIVLVHGRLMNHKRAFYPQPFVLTRSYDAKIIKISHVSYSDKTSYMNMNRSTTFNTFYISRCRTMLDLNLFNVTEEDNYMKHGMISMELDKGGK